MTDEKVVTINERIPKLKEQRKQRANRRLIFFMSFFFLLILIVIYFQSSLSHTKTIEVIGNKLVEQERILENSQLSIGTSIWTVNIEQVKSNIELLDEVEYVLVTRKLPTTIIINVKEHKRVAYLYEDGKYYPILENGRYLEELPRHFFPADAPILKGWEQGSAVVELAAELNKVPESITNRISEIYHNPSLSDSMRIVLYMNDGFEVHSTIRQFSERILPYPAIVKELDPEIKGIIHMRMTPYFEQYEIEEESENEGEG